jgi:hypothetical protein
VFKDRALFVVVIICSVPETQVSIAMKPEVLINNVYPVMVPLAGKAENTATVFEKDVMYTHASIVTSLVPKSNAALFERVR